MVRFDHSLRTCGRGLASLDGCIAAVVCWAGRVMGCDKAAPTHAGGKLPFLIPGGSEARCESISKAPVPSVSGTRFLRASSITPRQPKDSVLMARVHASRAVGFERVVNRAGRWRHRVHTHPAMSRKECTRRRKTAASAFTYRTQDYRPPFKNTLGSEVF